MVDRAPWPAAAVVIVTYDRPAEVRRTIAALVARLRYPGPLRWHLADDGSPGDYVASIVADFPQLVWTASVTPRRGWGANVNAALAAVGDCPYLFLCEDDYVATRALDVTRGVALLEAHEGLAAVRYDGISGHRLVLHLEEQPTRLGPVTYAAIDASASPCLNVYSNRPHLRHAARFARWFGPYPEGRPLGETEEAYAHTVRDRSVPEAPRLAILEDGIAPAFDHIGTSRQHTAADQETQRV